MAQKNEIQKAEKIRKKYIGQLNALMTEVAQKAQEQLDQYSRQVAYDDVFTEYLEAKKILQPPYSFDRMFELVESSPILPACIEAYKENIDGFGHDIIPKEGVDEGNITTEMKDQAQEAIDLFSNPNGKESFQTLRRFVTDDKERAGNGFMEVIRTADRKPALLFWADVRRIRALPYAPSDYVDTTIIVKRGRSEVKVPHKRWFRRFIMITHSKSTDAVTYKYFKEYGDPRIISSETGVVGATKTPASELIHFKIGTGAYGIPRWIGNLMRVLGLHYADYVNHDLFNNQGIPPMILMLMGGYLTAESYNNMIQFFKNSLKGVKNFNKWLFLEAQAIFPEVMPDSNTSTQRPELKIEDLSKIRKDDVMFLKYMDMAIKTTRTLGFRLPGLYVGESDEFNYATARIARETTERQVFVPQRNDFDEKMNFTIMPDLGVTDYLYKSRGPSMVDSEQIGTVLGTLINGGAFTINELIAQANKIFNLSLEPYDAEWASNIPIPMLLAMGPENALINNPDLTKEDLEKVSRENLLVYKTVSNIENMIRKAIEIRRPDDHENTL